MISMLVMRMIGGGGGQKTHDLVDGGQAQVIVGDVAARDRAGRDVAAVLPEAGVVVVVAAGLGQRAGAEDVPGEVAVEPEVEGVVAAAARFLPVGAQGRRRDAVAVRARRQRVVRQPRRALQPEPDPVRPEPLVHRVQLAPQRRAVQQALPRAAVHHRVQVRRDDDRLAGAGARRRVLLRGQLRRPEGGYALHRPLRRLRGTPSPRLPLGQASGGSERNEGRRRSRRGDLSDLHLGDSPVV